jgi:3-methyladenine DNA glycosylase AlkC
VELANNPEQLTPADQALVVKYREGMLAQDKICWSMPSKTELRRLPSNKLELLKDEFNKNMSEPVKQTIRTLAELSKSENPELQVLASQCITDPLGPASRQLIRIARRIKLAELAKQ